MESAPTRPRTPSTASIVQVKPLGQQRVIDLEVRSEHHNFVADGVVVGNSHSFAYALIAAQTLYLKTHFPIEFFCASLSGVRAAKDKHDRLRGLVSDAMARGVKVIGVDINDSKVDFTIARDRDDPSKEVIRYGLSHIKMVGQAAEEIVAGQPYRSVGDYLRRGARRKDIVVNLIHAGAFDRFSQNRIALVTYFESWCRVTKKAVGPQRYENFLKAIGLQDKKQEIAAFKEACSKSSDEDDQVPEVHVDEVTTVEDQSLADVPVLDIVPEEMAKSSSVVEKKKPKKTDPMEVAVFKRWAANRWRDRVDDQIFDLAMDDAIGDLIPPDFDDTIVDMAPAVRLRNAEEAYGAMPAFLNPINHVTVPVMWISNYGKRLPPEAGGDKIGKLQDCIDGFVVSVEKRTSRNDKSSGKPYWRIKIDDGYNQAWVTSWLNVWEAAGFRREVPVTDEKGCRILIGVDGDGKQIFKMRKVMAPSEIIEKNKIVRLRVKGPTKWGFTLDGDVGDPASLLPTTEDWPNVPS